MNRVTCAVGLVPYDTADFDWFEGMDPRNVQNFTWALQGEEVLLPEVERRAADMLERVAADPAKVLPDEFRLSESDRAELARPERHDIIRQFSIEAVRNGSGAGLTTTFARSHRGGSTLPRSACQLASAMASAMCSCPRSTVSGSRVTCPALKLSSRKAAISPALISSPNGTAGSFVRSERCV